MTSTIGIRLLTERKRLGLKQSAVTQATGISKTTIHRYENDFSIPSTKSVQALKTLGFDMDYVLTGVTQEEGDITPQELAFIKLLRQAQPVISKLNVWAFNELTQTYLLRLPLISPSDRMAAFLRCIMQVPRNTDNTCFDEVELVEAKIPHHLYTQLINVHADLPNSPASVICSYVPSQPVPSNTAVLKANDEVGSPLNPSRQHKHPTNSPSVENQSILKHQERQAIEATQLPQPQSAPEARPSFGC